MWCQIKGIIMSIEYDPSKTRQEMADAAGVSIIKVGNFLQRNGYNYREDRANYLRCAVPEYFAKHPDVSMEQAADDLKLSVPTIKEYLKPVEEYKKGEKRERKTVCYKNLSVANTDTAILRSILDLYLPGKRTFDCDLTFGSGGFYSGGLAVPEFRYDKYLYGAKGSKRNKAKSLEETDSIPEGRFDSVVIDLPINIDNKDSGVNAFKTLNAMFDAYHNMISLASRILKSGGILVFKTVDFVLRNDDEASYRGEWATDNAIDFALQTGFDLTDRFILTQRKSLVTSGSAKIRKGLKHGYFLVFTKL